MQKEFRPSKIEEVFGQDHIKPTISRWIHNPESIPKALLLHGPYGCSKTTFARMLANVLTTSPTDIHEINAANANGVDDVRAIAESTAYSGFGGNKVYILDEFHMMTAQAQSALLKVIEEPNEGIYFIFCTTDFAKLLPQIRSRCTSLEVKLLSETEAFALMKFLDSSVSEDLMTQIYLSSGGHARDIVKALAVGISHPQAIAQIVANINNAQANVRGWFEGKADVNPWEYLNADEPSLRMLCDFVCDNPSVLGPYFTQGNYNQLLQQRANSLIYLVTQKQRYIHMISLRYPDSELSALHQVVQAINELKQARL